MLTPTHSSLSSFSLLFFVLTPITRSLPLAHFISLSTFLFLHSSFARLSFLYLLLLQFSLPFLSFTSMFLPPYLPIRPDFSFTVTDGPSSVSQANSQLRPTKCLPVRQLSLWTVIQTDFGLSLPVTETRHGNRPLLETNHT